MAGEITVELASPPPNSIRSKAAPFIERTNVSLRRWRIRSSSWTQAGSSYVARISRSMPTRQAASCQQPGWPKTSKQQTWPRVIPRWPNASTWRLTAGTSHLGAGQNSPISSMSAFCLISRSVDPGRVLVGLRAPSTARPWASRSGSGTVGILGVRHGLRQHPPSVAGDPAGAEEAGIALEWARRIRRPTRPADARRPIGSRPCRNGRRTPGREMPPMYVFKKCSIT